MKKVLLIALWSVIAISINAQTIGVNTVTITPTNPDICGPVTLTADGFYACANWSVQSTNSSSNGSQLTAELFINVPQICLPAIVPFSTPINLGILPEGSYTAGLRYYLDGTLEQTVPFNFSVAGLSASTSNITSSTATLNWSNLPCACDFQVRGKPVGAPNFINISVPAGTTSFNAAGLTPSSSYEWQVRSVCPNDTTNWSSLKTFTTVGCFAPTSLTTLGVTSSTATIIWAGSADASVYQIFGRVAGSGAVASFNINAPNTAFAASGLLPGTTYEWAIRTVCTSGFASAFSPTNTFTTSSGPTEKTDAAFEPALGSSTMQVYLYPNPAKDHLNIDFINTAPSNQFSLTVYNAEGKSVLSSQHKDHNGRIKLNLDQLPQGLYHANFSNDKEMISKKIMIVR